MHPEGSLRMVPAAEHQLNGITPIAVEKMTGGKWLRVGYAGGSALDSPIITLDEWIKAVSSASAP